MVSEELLCKYRDMGSEPVRIVEDSHTYQILKRNVLSFEDHLIRHDSNKIKAVLEELINSEEG